MKNFIIPIIVICILCVTGCKEKSKTGPNLDSEPQYGEQVQLPPETQSEISIIPIEHATTVLEWGDVTIYIDPVGGAEVFKNQKQPDLILITDVHGDHLNVETLEGLNTSNAKIMVPQAVANKIPSKYTPQLDILNNGDSKERFGITVEAIPMYNLREEAKAFHEKGRGNGYVLNLGSQRIYFSGDTEDIPEMRALKNIDKAFICMNLPYTMTEESASNAVLEFIPQEVYPYHYRGRPDVSDVNKFKELVNKGNPEISVIQLDWYPNDDY